jgi:hypothetical protein
VQNVDVPYELRWERDAERASNRLGEVIVSEFLEIGGEEGVYVRYGEGDGDPVAVRRDDGRSEVVGGGEGSESGDG